jgi:hypothetical protein
MLRPLILSAASEICSPKNGARREHPGHVAISDPAVGPARREN